MFGLTRFMYDARKKDGKTFYCPNGHPRAYRETENDRLRRERDQLKQRIAQKDDTIKCLQEDYERIERRRRAAVGQISRIKNRVGHGICPCCNRTFENLGRHMASQHPTYSVEAIE